MLGMLQVFAQFEKALVKEWVKSGIKRYQSELIAGRAFSAHGSVIALEASGHYGWLVDEMAWSASSTNEAEDGQGLTYTNVSERGGHDRYPHPRGDLSTSLLRKPKPSD